MSESDHIKAVPGAVSTADPRVPWWWNAIMSFVVRVGLPVAILSGVLGFFMWERVTVLKEQTKTTEGMTRSLDRIVPILDRMERRLPEK